MTLMDSPPIKKSKQAIKLYKEAGPVFGEIIYSIYKKLRDSDEYFDIESMFMSEVSSKFQYYRYNKRPSLPFIDVKNHDDILFGRAVCISYNDVIAHGKPWDCFKKGDVVSVDCGLGLPIQGKQLHFDAAFTVVVGSGQQKNWSQAPHDALCQIVKRQPKNTMDIANLISNVALSNELNQVVSLTGHGIGYHLHEAPAIYNAPGDFHPVDLFEGMCFCAEPIFVNPKQYNRKNVISQICIADNGWDVLTTSGEPSSHFETTFAIEDGKIIDVVGITNWEF